MTRTDFRVRVPSVPPGPDTATTGPRGAARSGSCSPTDNELSFSILGTMRVLAGRHEVSLGPPGRRALLGILLVHTGQAVSIDKLVAELWPVRLPRNPTATVHSYVSKLRRALSVGTTDTGAPPALPFSSGSYLLDVDPDRVDSRRFEDHVAEGRRLLAGQDVEAASIRLASALTMWRGSAYAESGECSALSGESFRLEQVRVAAIEALAGARLALGRADLVAEELDGEVRRYPLRERLVAHHMTALYQLGRQAEALMVYDRTRACLADEFGVDAGKELQHIYEAVLRQELPSPRAAQGRTVPTSGSAARADVDDPPAPTCAGREPELARLRAVFAGGNGANISVLGEAGIGKTQLLVDLSGQLRTAGTDVVWGHCYPDSDAPPYWLWRQVLLRLRQLHPDLGTTSGSDVRQLLADLTTRPPDESAGRPRHDRFLMIDAVCDVLLAAADSRPLALFLEDLQWIDPHSLDVLRLLGARRSGSRLSVVTTARDPDSHRSTSSGHHWLDTAWHRPGVDIVRLTGLSAEAFGTLVAARTDCRPETIAELHARTGGNPYFLGQLLSVADATSTRIPVTVRHMIEERLAALPASAFAALTRFARLGVDIDPATATDEPAVQVALAAGLLTGGARSPARLHFTHGLTHELLLEERTDA